MIDKLLDRFTMFRLLFWGLAVLWAAALLGSWAGWLPFQPLALTESTVLLVGTSVAANAVFAWIFRVGIGHESSVLTALILVFLVQPATFDSPRWVILALVAVVAMASKYALAFRRQHLFNPAVIGVLFASWVFHDDASWWVGQSFLLPVVAVVGLLITVKIRRAILVLVYLASFTVLALGFGWAQGLPFDQAAQNVGFLLGGTEVVFLGAVMLTEPATSPGTPVHQVVYAILVALFAQPQLTLFGFGFSPELALLVGNVYAWVVGPKRRLRLTLKRVDRLGGGVLAFAFDRPQDFSYEPGQAMEWTLPMGRSDSRGKRRWFSFSSSPTESELVFAARFPRKPSRFKVHLATLSPGATLDAAHLSGHFRMPRPSEEPLVLIAGGVGVTPFRSMIQAAVDRGETRNLTLVYSVRHPASALYVDVWKRARAALGLKLVVTITGRDRIPENWPGDVGRIDATLLRRRIADPKRSRYMVSGTQPFVSHVVKTLRQLSVPRSHIQTDLFSGYGSPSPRPAALHQEARTAPVVAPSSRAFEG